MSDTALECALCGRRATMREMCRKLMRIALCNTCYTGLLELNAIVITEIQREISERIDQLFAS